MQVCTSLQTDNHASTPPLVFYRLDALSAAQPTASKHGRQSRGHCNWQIGLIFIAKLQMYRVRRPTINWLAINCHQTASKCTKSNKSRTQFQKFSRGDTYARAPALAMPGAQPPRKHDTLASPLLGTFASRPPVPDWDSKKVATLV